MAQRLSEQVVEWLTVGGNGFTPQTSVPLVVSQKGKTVTVPSTSGTSLGAYINQAQAWILGAAAATTTTKSGQLIVSSSDASAGSGAAIELWNGTNTSWHLFASGDSDRELYIGNNYNDGVKTSYTPNITFGSGDLANQYVYINSTKDSNYTHSATGAAFIVEGGATFGGKVYLNNNTQATSGGNAALKVAGGVFVGDDIYARRINAVGTTADYLTCSTAAGTAAKTITISGIDTDDFIFKTGTEVYVKFANDNTVASPTLNINGKGAKAIYKNGTRLEYQAIANNIIYHLIYDGTYWQVLNDWDLPLISCSTAAGTAAKTATCQGFSLIPGTTIEIKFTNLNSIDNPTLNINGTGAKPIYYKDARVKYQSLAQNFVYKMVYDGTNYQIINDYELPVVNSATAASTAAKVATCEGFVPYEGAIINVTFSNENSANNPTLNINSTGALGIYHKGSRVVYAGITTGMVYQLMVQSSTYVVINTIKPRIGTCSTSASAAAKTVICPGFVLYTGATAEVKFSNDSSAATPTLNINSTGAKNIYWAKSTTGHQYKFRGDYVYKFVYDGTYYRPIDDHFQHAVTRGVSAASEVTDPDTGEVITPAVSAVTGTETLYLGNQVTSNTNAGMNGQLGLYGSGVGYHLIKTALTGSTNRSYYLPNYSGDGYLTHVPSASAVGSNTEPVYVAANGRITALTYTSNRLYYSASTTSFEATGHYASTTKIAINSTSAPTDTLYVNGNASIATNSYLKVGQYITIGGNGDPADRSIMSSTTLYAGSNGNASMIFKTNGTARARFDTSGHFRPEDDSTYDIGASSYHWRNGYFDGLSVSSDTNFIDTNSSNYNGLRIGGAGDLYSMRASSGGGLYVRGLGADYGRLYISTIGTASNGTTQGTQGNTILQLGNGTARAAATETTGANNARGIVRIYSTSTTYSDLLSQVQTTSRNVWLPNTNTDAEPILMATHDLNGSQNLNEKYNAGIYCIEGGSVINYPAGSTAYANLLVIPYRKPYGNTTPDHAFQIYSHTNYNRLWFRGSNATAWAAWREVAHIAANTAVGSGTKGVYVTAAGVVTAMSYSLSATVNAGTANHFSYYSGANAISAEACLTTNNTGDVTLTSTGSNRARFFLTTASDNPNDFYFKTNNANQWSISARGSADGYYLGIYKFSTDGWHTVFSKDGNIEIKAGLLKITKSSNTVTIGSQNSGFCHIYNSANIPFIFNNTVATTTGDLGTSTYKWGKGYFKGDIIMQGTSTSANNRVYFYYGDGNAEGFVGHSIAGDHFGLYSARLSKYIVDVQRSNNRIYFADSYNGNAVALAYSQSALANTAITYLACWNGYELRAINKLAFVQTASVSNTSAAASGANDQQAMRQITAIQSQFSTWRTDYPMSFTMSTGNRSVAFGYLINGDSYNTTGTAYGGYFIAHYGNAKYLGISNGSWQMHRLIFGPSGGYYGALSSRPASAHNGDVYFAI